MPESRKRASNMPGRSSRLFPIRSLSDIPASSWHSSKVTGSNSGLRTAANEACSSEKTRTTISRAVSWRRAMVSGSDSRSRGSRRSLRNTGAHGWRNELAAMASPRPGKTRKRDFDASRLASSRTRPFPIPRSPEKTRTGPGMLA